MTDHLKKLSPIFLILLLVPEHLISRKRIRNSRGGFFSSPEKGLKWLKKSAGSPRSTKRITTTEKQMDAAYKIYQRL